MQRKSFFPLNAAISGTLCDSLDRLKVIKLFVVQVERLFVIMLLAYEQRPDRIDPTLHLEMSIVCRLPLSFFLFGQRQEKRGEGTRVTKTEGWRAKLSQHNEKGRENKTFGAPSSFLRSVKLAIKAAWCRLGAEGCCRLLSPSPSARGADVFCDSLLGLQAMLSFTGRVTSPLMRVALAFSRGERPQHNRLVSPSHVDGAGLSLSLSFSLSLSLSFSPLSYWA